MVSEFKMVVTDVKGGTVVITAMMADDLTSSINSSKVDEQTTCPGMRQRKGDKPIQHGPVKRRKW